MKCGIFGSLYDLTTALVLVTQDVYESDPLKLRHDLFYVGPPKFLFTSEEGTQGVSLGGSVALFCVVEGEPKPVIRWTKDGIPITDAQGRFQISDDGVHLRLPAAEENDAGRYACIASSPYGEISKHFDIKVICKFSSVQLKLGQIIV